jgi:uncharacterized membrane protein
VNWSGSSERRRVALSAAVGLAAAGLLSIAAAWQLVVLVGWIVTAIVLLSWIWIEIGRLDPATTAKVATREDDSRTAAWLALVASSVMSLVAIVAALHRASTAPIGLQVALTTASLLAVALSWLVVHTVFVLRYAHLFYGGRTVGGVDFPGDEAPCYGDFAYLSFTIGMTFQVSDTSITERSLRVTALRHALLSYLFSIAIIALMINVIAGLVS